MYDLWRMMFRSLPGTVSGLFREGPKTKKGSESSQIPVDWDENKTPGRTRHGESDSAVPGAYKGAERDQNTQNRFPGKGSGQICVREGVLKARQSVYRALFGRFAHLRTGSPSSVGILYLLGYDLSETPGLPIPPSIPWQSMGDRC